MDESDSVQDAESDGENDCEGYFLEPSPCTISIGERLAEANRQLFESDPEDLAEDDARPRKVQFCEHLVDFAPENPGYSTEEGDSASNASEEEFIEVEKESDESEVIVEELKKVLEESDPATSYEEDEFVKDETGSVEDEADFGQDEADVIVPEEKEKSEDKVDETEKWLENDKECSSKILLVLLPREQNSSCESLIGEEEEEESDQKLEEQKGVNGGKLEQKIRPKSANKGSKNKRGQPEKIQCKLVTISPDLNCSFEGDSKGWHESQNVKLRKRGKGSENVRTLLRDGQNSKKIGLKDGEKTRPNSSFDEGGPRIILPVLRPKTAPSKRPCCVIRSDLPHYDGLRSEYGLNAQQLQERKLKNAEIRQQRKVEKQSKQQEQQEKRLENEVRFSCWLEEKAVRRKSTSNGTHRKKDTLVRSDVFIQNNAVYASKCGVAYAVDYAFGRSKHKVLDIRRKTLNLGKLFENISPHAQRTYQIYVEAKP